MKKSLYWLTVASICMVGCESNSMCDVNEDCINMCRTYDNNSILYACDDGSCKCVDESKLKCTGDPEKDKCAAICEKYRPGTVGSCVKNMCACVAPSQDEDSSSQ